AVRDARRRGPHQVQPDRPRLPDPRRQAVHVPRRRAQRGHAPDGRPSRGLGRRQLPALLGAREPLPRRLRQPADDRHLEPVTDDDGAHLSDAREPARRPGDPMTASTTTPLETLREHLQTAIEIEWSTIPPYLCALWSLADGPNEYVAGNVEEVAMEEMLHLTLACNLLNAIGGPRGPPHHRRGAPPPPLPRPRAAPPHPADLPDVPAALGRRVPRQPAAVL